MDQLAREHGINLSDVKGTGSEGTITKQDVNLYIASKKPKQPASKKPKQPRKPSVADLTRICSKFSHNRYRVGDAIPQKKLANARSSFPIPSNERVIALTDTSWFGSNKTGLAVGANGIYWKNDWATSTDKTALSWREFASIRIRPAPDSRYDIILGNDRNRYGWSASLNRDDVVQLLTEIQTAVKASLT